MQNKVCTNCTHEKPLTEDYWYIARPREGHPSQGWQSFCRQCWRDKNKANKQRRKASAGV